MHFSIKLQYRVSEHSKNARATGTKKINKIHWNAAPTGTIGLTPRDFHTIDTKRREEHRKIWEEGRAVDQRWGKRMEEVEEFLGLGDVPSVRRRLLRLAVRRIPRCAHPLPTAPPLYASAADCSCSSSAGECSSSSACVRETRVVALLEPWREKTEIFFFSPPKYKKLVSIYLMGYFLIYSLRPISSLLYHCLYYCYLHPQVTHITYQAHSGPV